MTKLKYVKAAALTALIITLALTITANVATTETAWTIKQYVLHNITAGTVLAPHLYDWSFDGQDDYIASDSFENSYSYLSLIVRAKLVNGGNSAHVDVFARLEPVLNIYQNNAKYAVEGMAINESNKAIYTGRWSIAELPNPDDWFIIGVNYNETLSLWVNGVQRKSIHVGGTLYKTSVRWKIGYPSFLGYISYVIALNERINMSKLTNDIVTVLSENDLKVFFDPSFFNGSHFFDLVSGVVGVPYGGVSRVPANETWVWVIEGVYNDSLIHFRFFPPRTQVWVINSSGAVVAEYLVAPNASVYGSDFNVSVGGGEYTVIINLPVPIEVTQPTGTQTANLGGFTFVVPNPSDLLNLWSFMGWWYEQLGDLAYVIPLMIPATIYIKTRSYAATFESLIIISIAVMWLSPAAPILKLVVTAAGIALAYVIYYTLVIKG